jgi:hypothetical protein
VIPLKNLAKRPSDARIALRVLWRPTRQMHFEFQSGLLADGIGAAN